MLARLGPLGLSVLALVASFAIVFTAGGVLAAAGVGGPGGTPAPTTPQTPTRTATPAPAGAQVVAVTVDVADLGGGKASRLGGGATFYLRTASDDTGPQMSGGGPGPTLLCVSLSAEWSLPRAMASQWALYTKDDGAEHCRRVSPESEIRVLLERVR